MGMLARDRDREQQGDERTQGEEARQRRAPGKALRSDRSERAAPEEQREARGRSEGEEPRRADDWSMDAGLTSALGLGEEAAEGSGEGARQERKEGEPSNEGRARKEERSPKPLDDEAPRLGSEPRQLAEPPPRQDSAMSRAVEQQGGDGPQRLARTAAEQGAEKGPGEATAEAAETGKADDKSAAQGDKAGVKADGKAEPHVDDKADAKPAAKEAGKGEQHEAHVDDKTGAKPAADHGDPDGDSEGKDDAPDSSEKRTEAVGDDSPDAAKGARAAPAAGSHAAIAFADSDVERLVPVEPGEEPEARAARLQQARTQLVHEKAHAVARVGEFRQRQGQRIAALTQMAPQIDHALGAAEQRGVEQISHAEQAQAAAIRAEVARAVGSAQAAASAARAQIQASFTATTAAINAATTASKTALTSSHQQALDATGAAETKQLGEVTRLYAQAEGAFRTAATTAGSHAVSVAAGRASTYRASKIHRDDSFLDGALTDNRCEARAEAAEKVGQAYRDELGKEGDKQAAKMRERKPTDEAAVRQVAEEARRNLQTAHQASLNSLEQSSRQALTNAAKVRSGALAGTTRTLQDTLAALRRHEQAQVAAVQKKASGQKVGLRQQRQQAASAFHGAIAKAVADLNGGLDQSLAAFRNAEVPEEDALEQTLNDADQAVSLQLAQFGGGLEQGKTQATQGLAQSATSGVQELTLMGRSAVASAKQTGSGAAAAIAQGAAAAATSLREMSATHQRATTQLTKAGTTGNKQIADGVKTAYTTLSGNLQEGMRHNAEAVRTGLTEVVDRDMGKTITDEANEAASQVQPRWKSVLKWVIIIALVLVVAIFLGPLVIGAITGLAAGMGASAVVAGAVGAVVGGAIVGAGTAAVTTIVDNAFAGRTGWDLFNGVGTAMAWGALGGALGGGASALLAGPMQGMGALARYGVQVGVDNGLNVGISALQGNLTWESFGSGLLMSMLVNGVTAHPRVQLRSQAAMSRGYGAGFEGGIGIRNRVTGARPPGPTSIPANRMDHIARGDDVGGGHNQGKWNVSGGGHIPDEILPRADAEGISRRSRASSPDGYVDPISKVNVENFDRHAAFPQGTKKADIAAMGAEGLSRARAGAPGSSLSEDGRFTAIVDGIDGNPIEIQGKFNAADISDPTAYDVIPKRTFPANTENKSLFPPNTTRAQVEAMGIEGLNRALTGAPQTKLIPPSGTNSNGEFYATVLAPNGHPIEIAGRYKPTASGGFEIQTVHPHGDPKAAIVPVVGGDELGGSRTLPIPTYSHAAGLGKSEESERNE